jgi:DNA-binding transcriptional MerR regulator
MTYRIKTVEKITGISRNTITAWERRYQLLEPNRDQSGYRSYSESDVAKLRRVKELSDQGYQIGEILGMLGEQPAPAPSPRPLMSTPLLRQALEERLFALDRDGAAAVVQRAQHLGVRERLDQLLVPILHRTGDLWEQGMIGIGQEHFVSIFIRDEMLSMMRALDQGPANGPQAICSGFPSETHELGLLAVALHLALDGHRVTYLGPDLPAADLLEVLRERPARLVCTSLMLPRPSEEVLAWANYLAQRTPASTMIAIGGPGVTHMANASTDRVRFCASFDELTAQLRGR